MWRVPAASHRRRRWRSTRRPAPPPAPRPHRRRRVAGRKPPGKTTASPRSSARSAARRGGAADLRILRPEAVAARARQLWPPCRVAPIDGHAQRRERHEDRPRVGKLEQPRNLTGGRDEDSEAASPCTMMCRVTICGETDNTGQPSRSCDPGAPVSTPRTGFYAARDTPTAAGSQPRPGPVHALRISRGSAGDLGRTASR